MILELDLSRNLIETWADVAEICSGLENLRSLKLKYVSSKQALHLQVLLLILMYGSGNRFRDLSSTISGEHLESFPRVRELCLDETLLTWDEANILPDSWSPITNAFQRSSVSLRNSPL